MPVKNNSIISSGTKKLCSKCRSGGTGRPACRQAGALVIRISQTNQMYYVYGIKSIIRNYIYVGLTNNVERRFKEHNKAKEKTTRAYRPFELILIEKFETRKEARQREKHLKSEIGKEYLKTLT